MGSENNLKSRAKQAFAKLASDSVSFWVVTGIAAVLVLAFGGYKIGRYTKEAPTTANLFLYALLALAACSFVLAGSRLVAGLRTKKEAPNRPVQKISAAVAAKLTPAEAKEAFDQYLKQTFEARNKESLQINALLEGGQRQVPPDVQLVRRREDKEREARLQSEIQKLQDMIAAQREAEERAKRETRKLEEEFTKREEKRAQELAELKNIILANAPPRSYDSYSPMEDIIKPQEKAEEDNRRQQEMEELKATLREQIESSYAARAAEANNGFVFFDMPEDLKGSFRDLLVGFESFAQLRGYAVSVSVDTSTLGKLGFKLTLGPSIVAVSKQQVQQDMNTYVEAVQKGKLDELPMVLPPKEHAMVLLNLKTRASVLENTIQMQQLRLEDKDATIARFEGMLNRVFSANLPFGQPQNFYIEAGNAQAFAPVQSPNAVQGDNAHISGNTAHIGSNHTEKEHQIELVEALRKALAEHREGIDEQKLEQANQQLQKVTEELKEEPKPDPTRVHRWLETAKYALKAAALSHEVTDAFKKVCEIFHILPLG